MNDAGKRPNKRRETSTTAVLSDGKDGQKKENVRPDSARRLAGSVNQKKAAWKKPLRLPRREWCPIVGVAKYCKARKKHATSKNKSREWQNTTAISKTLAYKTSRVNYIHTNGENIHHRVRITNATTITT